jgi:hypothetical protein
LSPVVYRGKRDANQTAVVTKQIDDLPEQPLDLRLDLRRHSPSGGEWGYNGSGPAQTALGILADVMGDEFAADHYQRLKFDIIGRLPREGFEITADAVEAWAKELEGEG